MVLTHEPDASSAAALPDADCSHPGAAGGEVVNGLLGLQHQFASLDAGARVGDINPRTDSRCLPRPVPQPCLSSFNTAKELARQQLLANLLRVRSLASATRARLEQQRTHEFLHACSSGNLERIRVVRTGRSTSRARSTRMHTPALARVRLRASQPLRRVCVRTDAPAGRGRQRLRL